MFSKPSRLFFWENQEIITVTGKFWFEPYYYKFNSIFKQQTFPNMKLTKKMRNTILNNYWYKETIKILIDSMIFQVYKASALISSPILTRFQGKSGTQRVKYFK